MEADGGPLSPTTSDICRVTIVTPNRSADLALPTYLPLVDLLPTLAGIVDQGIVNEASGRGLILQRLGEPPLDEERTPAALGLRDGDVLHLRVADEPMPPLRFDDLIDGVAVRLGQLPARWNSQRIRPLFVGLTGLALVLGLVLLGLDGSSLVRSVVAAVLGVSLVGASASATYALRDDAVAILFATGAVAYASAAGTIAPGAVADVRELATLRVLVGCAAAVFAATLARVLLGRAAQFFFGLLIVSLFGAAAATLVLFSSLSVAQASSAAIAVALILSLGVPSAAFRLSGMRMPDLPQTVDDINRPADPIEESVVARRTESADDYVTAMYAVLCVVVLVGVGALVHERRSSGLAYAAVVCVTLLFRARVLSGLWQRVWLVSAAALGLSGVVLRLTTLMPGSLRSIPVVAVGLVGTLSLVAAARLLPDRTIRPYWGRAAEILESLLAVALVPLGLAAIGLLTLARQLGS
jgi:type VII secretion integral membrane protein EccD